MSSQLERQQLKERNERSPRNKASLRSISKDLYEHPVSLYSFEMLHKLIDFFRQPRSKYFPIQIVLNANHLALTLLSKFVYGNFWLSVFDYFTDKLEKTLDFCIPEDFDADNRKTMSSNQRPLNWLLFIPALIGLRLLFFYLSVISIVLGNGEVTAKQLVRNI